MSKFTGIDADLVAEARDAIALAGGCHCDLCVEIHASTLKKVRDGQRERDAQQAELFAGPLAKMIARVIRQNATPPTNQQQAASVPHHGEVS